MQLTGIDGAQGTATEMNFAVGMEQSAQQKQ